MSFTSRIPILDTIKLGFEDEQLADTIIKLLCLTDHTHYNIQNIKGRVEIYFRGDMKKTRDIVYEWLSKRKSLENKEGIEENKE